MIFPFEIAKPSGNAVIFQGGEHLHTLRHGAAVVLIGVDKQGGGDYVFRVAQRRKRPELFRVVKRIAVALIRSKEIADVRHAIEGKPVGDGTLGGGAGKAVGVSDDPVGHKTAVGAACDGHALFINLRIAFQYSVGEVHEILIINLAVFSPDIRKSVVSAVAAFGIAEENKIAPVCPDLHFVVKHRAVGGLGTAVDVQNGGIGLFRVKVLGQQYPAANIQAATSHADGLMFRHIFSHQGFVVKMAEAGKLACCKVAAVQLLQAVFKQPHQQSIVGVLADGKAVHASGFGQYRNGRPCGSQLLELCVAFSGGNEKQFLAPGQHGRTPAVAAIAAYAAVHILFFRA